MASFKLGKLVMTKVVHIMANVNINNTNENLFIVATEIGKLLGVCRSKAYKIIQELNDELKTKDIRVQTYICWYLTELTEQLKRLESIEKNNDVLENIKYLLELIDKMGGSNIKETPK